MCGIISAGGRDDWLHDDRSDNSGALQRVKRTSAGHSPSKDVGHVCDEARVQTRWIDAVLQMQCHRRRGWNSPLTQTLHCRRKWLGRGMRILIATRLLCNELSGVLDWLI